MHQTSATSLARDGPGPPTPADATDVRTDTIAASPETDPTAIQSMSRRPSPAPPASAAAVCARVLMARSVVAVQNARVNTVISSGCDRAGEPGDGDDGECEGWQGPVPADVVGRVEPVHGVRRT